ncbi:hypothetical protein BCON_0069g00180 [Botryotinia convoluta]|uniref:ATP-dependent DNA helicase n=1 Tax=Botryotinia convoluta TaxID=54673 RepID=A0A4Z1I8T2_9HELO|nr:hypothetical protein BCON_0069g00180 [Botryotinia convoluta]
MSKIKLPAFSSSFNSFGNRLSANYPRRHQTVVWPTIMGRKGPKKNYFVVCRGRTTGILNGWLQCEMSTSGFSGASYRGYVTHNEAQKAWNEWLESQGFAPSVGAPHDTLENNLTDMSRIVNQAAIDSQPQAHIGMKRKYEDRNSSPDVKAGVVANLPRPITGEVSAQHMAKTFIDLTESPERMTSNKNLLLPEEKNAPVLKKAKSDDNQALNLDIEIPDSEFELSDDDIFNNIEATRGSIPMSVVELTAEQNTVVQMAMSKDNIFLTGAAGSGKTATLLRIIESLKEKLMDDNPDMPKVQVAAPTGLAALPLNGRTTYSVAGWKPDSFKQPLDELLHHKTIKKRTVKALRKLEVLILEEISMVESQFLERLNLLFQTVKQNKEPFGGIQVIFLGDFYQIPPVKPFEHCMVCGVEMVGVFDRICENSLCKNCHIPFKPGDKWAFNAPVWRKLNFRHVKLEQIHRQKDETFKALLNKVRNGVDLSDAEWHDLVRPKKLPPNAFPIRLMAKRFDVDRFNYSQLNLLQSEAKVWEAYDDSRKLFQQDHDYLRQLEIKAKLEKYKIAISEYHRFPPKLTLKVGAKVVLLQNQEQKIGLVNGSQGTIVGFANAKEWRVDIQGEDHADWRQLQMRRFVEKNPWRPISG